MPIKDKYIVVTFWLQLANGELDGDKFQINEKLILAAEDIDK